MSATGFEALIFGLLALLPRMLAILYITPVFARDNLTGLVRGALAVALVVPALPVTIETDVTIGSELFAILIKEGLLGGAIGMVIAMPFWVADSLGVLLDNERGASSSTLQNPDIGSESSPLGILVYQAYLILFILLGGLTTLVDIVYDSYALWPVGTWSPVYKEASTQAFINIFQNMVKVTALLAAPVVIIMFLTELILAIASLFAPQLQVFPLAMPIKSGTGIFVLLIYVPILMTFMAPSVADLRSNVLGIIR